MDIKISPRGFEYIEFIDHNGIECSLQQSSAIDFNAEGAIDNPGSSLIWLGVRENRMHLDRDTVSDLVQHLCFWLETGSFDYLDPKGGAMRNKIKWEKPTIKFLGCCISEGTLSNYQIPPCSNGSHNEGYLCNNGSHNVFRCDNGGGVSE